MKQDCDFNKAMAMAMVAMAMVAMAMVAMAMAMVTMAAKPGLTIVTVT